MIMDYNTKYNLQMIGAVIGLLVSAVLFADGMLWFGCNNYAATTEREVKYVHFDQCYVRGGDTWLTKAELVGFIIGENK